MNTKLIIRYCLVISCIIMGNTVFSQTNDTLQIKAIARQVLTKGTAYDNLQFICKKIGARLSGSRQAQQAVEATAVMLKKAGADTVYLQPCMVPHWQRGIPEKGVVSITGMPTRNLKICALGNSIGTGIKGVKASVVMVNNFLELEQLGTEGIQGKVVFFNFAMDPTLIRTFTAYGQSGGGRREGPTRAARYGAVAALVRSLASNDDDFPHTGTTAYNDSFPKIAALAISTNDANWLSEQITTGKKPVVYLQNTSKMLPDALSFNVIGELRGTANPEQIITVGGHLDSWDLAEGAHDDGAGIVQSIEVINSFTSLGIRPKRTIRAVMFMNEENGGKGAAAYLAEAIRKKEQHLFALESDAGGFTPRGFSLDMAPDKQAVIRQWQPLFLPYGVYEFNGGGSGADIGPLKKIGAALAGLTPDSQRYFDLHHAAKDVFEQVSKRELLLGAINMCALIYLVDQHGL